MTGLDIIKCPHCGYTYQMNLAEFKRNRETIVTKGLFGKGEPKLESSKDVDLKCPNPKCGKWFIWNVN